MRATRDFVEALVDYERSNQLLFSDDDAPKPGGWRLPKEIQRLKEERSLGVAKKPRGRPAKRPPQPVQDVVPST
jgi:hypothetical protein